VIGVVEIEDHLVATMAQISALDRVEEVATTAVCGLAVGGVPEGEEHPAPVGVEPKDVE
jgi:hypothetical protein